MKHESQERVVTMVLLACFEAYAGPLPKGMFTAVVSRLAGREWDDAEAFLEAAQLLAQEFLLESGTALELTGAGDDEAN